MLFESRELKPYGEFVRSAELVEGRIYFRVSFLDKNMLIPEMIPLVFIGRNLQPNSHDLYFQDAASYIDGERHKPEDWDRIMDENSADIRTHDLDCRLETMEDKEYTIVFEYEKALDQLLKCSLERKRVGLE